MTKLTRFIGSSSFFVVVDLMVFFVLLGVITFVPYVFTIIVSHPIILSIATAITLIVIVASPRRRTS